MECEATSKGFSQPRLGERRSLVRLLPKRRLDRIFVASTSPRELILQRSMMQETRHQKSERRQRGSMAARWHPPINRAIFEAS
jgi:ADP-heptose:LPS heptosyltransferase